VLKAAKLAMTASVVVSAPVTRMVGHAGEGERRKLVPLLTAPSTSNSQRLLAAFRSVSLARGRDGDGADVVGGCSGGCVGG
jgi:hypothetical protein